MLLESTLFICHVMVSCLAWLGLSGLAHLVLAWLGLAWLGLAWLGLGWAQAAVFASVI